MGLGGVVSVGLGSGGLVDGLGDGMGLERSFGGDLMGLRGVVSAGPQVGVVRVPGARIELARAPRSLHTGQGYDLLEEEV